MSVETIFTQSDDEGNEGELGIDYETSTLYWNGRKILTEQKLSLEWWVNLSIVFGGISTVVMAITAILDCLNNS